MGFVLDTVGKWIAAYLQKELPGYEPFTPSDPERVARPHSGGRRSSGRRQQPYFRHHQVSDAIDMVARRALCRADRRRQRARRRAACADRGRVGEGVISAPLSKYLPLSHPLLPPGRPDRTEDRVTVCRYAIDRIGFGYDLKNIIDLMRYLIPLPVPQRWRRRMIALGSGDPTRIICSALIAQAFERGPLSDPAEGHPRRQPQGARARFCTSAIPRFTRRAISTSRRISRSSSRRSSGVSITLSLHWADKQKPLAEVASVLDPIQVGAGSLSFAPAPHGSPRRWKR